MRQMLIQIFDQKGSIMRIETMDTHCFFQEFLSHTSANPEDWLKGQTSPL